MKKETKSLETNLVRMCLSQKNKHAMFEVISFGNHKDIIFFNKYYVRVTSRG